MGLLIILAVVPTLQIARLGVDEDIANVLAGFRIVLSPDKHEVVRLVIYYMWCVEGEWNQEAQAAMTDVKHTCIYFCGTLFIGHSNSLLHVFL